MDIGPSKRGASPKILTYQNLLSGIKMPESSPFAENELKTELYNRIINKLYQKCERLCKKNRIDDPNPIVLTQDIIIKGFSKISTFVLESSWDEIKCENKIAAWLSVIANNHLIDLLYEKAKSNTDEFEDYEIEDNSQRPDQFEFENDDTIELRLQDAMDGLNNRERYIINVCLKHDCLGNNNHLPDEVIEEICCSLGIKKGHERVIKLRALKKLEQRLKKN
jgi:RNA polymerase sigma factor (sigma-70 family)